MKRSIATLVLGIVAAACGGGPTAVAPATLGAPSSPDTPVPSVTPAPPTSTQTPVPATATMEPPIGMASYLTNSVIYAAEPFHSLPSNAVDASNMYVTNQDDALQIVGQPWDNDGAVGLWTGARYAEGQGAIFDFMLKPDVSSFDFQASLGVGDFSTPGYRSIAIHIAPRPEVFFWTGPDGSKKFLAGELKIVGGTWYQAMLVVGKGADFLGVVTERDNPQSAATFHATMGSDWQGKTWDFGILGGAGTMLVDNWLGVSFDSIK